jgi:hypothetical protein
MSIVSVRLHNEHVHLRSDSADMAAFDDGGLSKHGDNILPHFLHTWACKSNKKLSESVYRKRTDNTMAKRKSTKGQTTIYKTYT